jgi:PHD/YefM family antitoxin component YafN of YafNO toxin-antitoxin module
MIISANEVKVKGIGFIEEKIKENEEVYISVRGKKKFVILSIKDYEKLKEAELDKIIREAEEDYKAGRIVKESAKEHFKKLKI